MTSILIFALLTTLLSLGAAFPTRRNSRDDGKSLEDDVERITKDSVRKVKESTQAAQDYVHLMGDGVKMMRKHAVDGITNLAAIPFGKKHAFQNVLDNAGAFVVDAVFLPVTAGYLVKDSLKGLLHTAAAPVRVAGSTLSHGLKAAAERK